MLFLSFLGIIINNFGKKTFNTTKDPPSFDLSYLILPYFSSHANLFQVFNDFQNSTDSDTEIATALVDCSTRKTTCSKLQLIPGFLYASFPPHDPQNNIKKFDVTIDSIDPLNIIYSRLKNSNVEFIQTGTIDDIYKRMITSNGKIKPAFILASLPKQESNSDEIEEKLHIFQQVAVNYINTDILFLYVTSPDVYQKLNIYPNTEVFYLSPTDKPIKFRTSNTNIYSESDHDEDLDEYFSSNSELSYDDFNPFVQQHSIPLFEEASYKLFEHTQLFITYVGNSPTSEEMNSLKIVHNHIPVIFVNNTKYPFLASAICQTDFDDKLQYLQNLIKLNNKYQTTSKCIALTNFSSSRSVMINNLNVDDILKTKNDFNRIYLESTNRVNQFIQQLMSELQFEKELVLAKFVSFIFLWIVISGISFKFRPKKKQQLQAPTFKAANSEKERKE